MDENQEGPFPRSSRPGSRTFSVCTGPYEVSRITRVGLDLLDILDAELDDYRAGRKGADGRGIDADAYAGGEEDRSVWEGPRLLAIIRPRAGGDPEVFRFDEGQPLPAEDLEHRAWAIVKEIGADEAIRRLSKPDLPPLPPPKPLTMAERHALSAVGMIGEEETMNRLLLAGPYQGIYEAIGRLGWDAVAELRRVAAVGERDRGIIARAAEVLDAVDVARLGFEDFGITVVDVEAFRQACSAIASARSILGEAG